MRRSPVRVVSALVCGAVVTAACAATERSPGGASGTTAPTTPSVIAPGEWVAGSDPASGISFSLPGTVKTETRPGNDGTPGAKRAYLCRLSADLTVSVIVTDGALSAEDLDLMPDQLAEQMATAGATDAKVEERERTTVEGRPALDFRFSFTAKTGKRSFWLTRQIAGDRHVVLLQSIAFSASPDAAFENLVRDYHRQLVAGLKLA